MSVIKTPGVYTVETGAFPNAIVEVATAVPAFVGYTSRSDNHGKPLRMKPWRISSLDEFDAYFGGPPLARFRISQVNANPTVNQGTPSLLYALQQTSVRYRLYYGMRLFFLNGGGPCYIVSVGEYGDPIASASLIDGIATLEREAEPTLLVIPDAVSLPFEDCIEVQQAMLGHCGGMHNRFAILDVWGGDQAIGGDDGPVARFRSTLGSNHLNFGAAYYPWLHTTIVPAAGADLRMHRAGELRHVGRAAEGGLAASARFSRGGRHKEGLDRRGRHVADGG